jgi:capsule polysaccharide export protein KpsE/RkpR
MLRNLFVKLKNNCDVKSSKISVLEAELTKAKTELQRLTDKAEREQGAPLLSHARNQQGLGYMGCLLLFQGRNQLG